MSELIPWGIALAAFVIAAMLIYLKGRSDKSKEQEIEELKREAEATKTRQGIDDEIQKADDDDLHRRADRWMRN